MRRGKPSKSFGTCRAQGANSVMCTLMTTLPYCYFGHSTSITSQKESPLKNSKCYLNIPISCSKSLFFFFYYLLSHVIFKSIRLVDRTTYFTRRQKFDPILIHIHTLFSKQLGPWAVTTSHKRQDEKEDVIFLNFIF